MWDNYEPQKITLDNTLTWIRNEFELTMQMKGVDFIVEGIEYKLFEDKEGKIFLPQHVVLDNSLMDEYPKPTYFLSPDS